MGVLMHKEIRYTGGGSGDGGDMTKEVYDTNDDGVVNEADVADSVKFSKTGGDVDVTFGIENNKYGYYDENNTFVDFKSQADIDSAVAAAKVGTATAGDVLTGKTFTNSTTSGVNGSMTNNGAVSVALNTSTTSYTVPAGYHNGSGTVSISTQTKSATPTTSAQTISPDSGKVLSSVTVNAISTQEKTSTPTTRSATAATITPDSGKYLTKVTVNTNSVPNSNSGTYTFAANDTGATKDLGATNTYRYVNAVNVYSKGSADGVVSGHRNFNFYWEVEGYSRGECYSRYDFLYATNGSTVKITGLPTDKNKKLVICDINWNQVYDSGYTTSATITYTYTGSGSHLYMFLWSQTGAIINGSVTISK